MSGMYSKRVSTIVSTFEESSVSVSSTRSLSRTATNVGQFKLSPFVLKFGNDIPQWTSQTENIFKTTKSSLLPKTDQNTENVWRQARVTVDYNDLDKATSSSASSTAFNRRERLTMSTENVRKSKPGAFRKVSARKRAGKEKITKNTKLTAAKVLLSDFVPINSAAEVANKPKKKSISLTKLGKQKSACSKAELATNKIALRSSVRSARSHNSVLSKENVRSSGKEKQLKTSKLSINRTKLKKSAKMTSAVSKTAKKDGQKQRRVLENNCSNFASPAEHLRNRSTQETSASGNVEAGNSKKITTKARKNTKIYAQTSKIKKSSKKLLLSPNTSSTAKPTARNRSLQNLQFLSSSARIMMDITDVPVDGALDNLNKSANSEKGARKEVQPLPNRKQRKISNLEKFGTNKNNKHVLSVVKKNLTPSKTKRIRKKGAKMRRTDYVEVLDTTVEKRQRNVNEDNNHHIKRSIISGLLKKGLKSSSITSKKSLSNHLATDLTKSGTTKNKDLTPKLNLHKLSSSFEIQLRKPDSNLKVPKALSEQSQKSVTPFPKSLPRIMSLCKESTKSNSSALGKLIKPSMSGKKKSSQIVKVAATKQTSTRKRSNINSPSSTPDYSSLKLTNRSLQSKELNLLALRKSSKPSGTKKPQKPKPISRNLGNKKHSKLRQLKKGLKEVNAHSQRKSSSLSLSPSQRTSSQSFARSLESEPSLNETRSGSGVLEKSGNKEPSLSIRTRHNKLSTIKKSKQSLTPAKKKTYRLSNALSLKKRYKSVATNTVIQWSPIHAEADLVQMIKPMISPPLTTTEKKKKLHFQTAKVTPKKLIFKNKIPSSSEALAPKISIRSLRSRKILISHASDFAQKQYDSKLKNKFEKNVLSSAEKHAAFTRRKKSITKTFCKISSHSLADPSLQAVTPTSEADAKNITASSTKKRAKTLSTLQKSSQNVVKKQTKCKLHITSSSAKGHKSMSTSAKKRTRPSFCGVQQHLGHQKNRNLSKSKSISLSNKASPKLSTGKKSFVIKKSLEIKNSSAPKRARTTRAAHNESNKLFCTKDKKILKPLLAEKQLQTITSTVSSKEASSVKSKNRTAVKPKPPKILSQKEGRKVAAKLNAQNVQSLKLKRTTPCKTSIIKINLVSRQQKRATKSVLDTRLLQRATSSAIHERVSKRSEKKTTDESSGKKTVQVHSTKTSLGVTQPSWRNMTPASQGQLMTSYTHPGMVTLSQAHRRKTSLSRVSDISNTKQAHTTMSTLEIADTSLVRTDLLSSDLGRKSLPSYIKDTSFSLQQWEFTTPSPSADTDEVSYTRQEMVNPLPEMSRKETHTYTTSTARKERVGPSSLEKITTSLASWTKDVRSVDNHMNVAALEAAASPTNLTDDDTKYRMKTPSSDETRPRLSRALLDYTERSDPDMKEIHSKNLSLTSTPKMAAGIRETERNRSVHIRLNRDNEMVNLVNEDSEETYGFKTEVEEEFNGHAEIVDSEKVEELDIDNINMKEVDGYDGDTIQSHSRNSQHCTVS